jgi:hypothetical protein
MMEFGGCFVLASEGSGRAGVPVMGAYAPVVLQVAQLLHMLCNLLHMRTQALTDKSVHVAAAFVFG